MKNEVSKALSEVWTWKEAAYSEVKGLPVADAVHERLRRVLETASRLKQDNASVARCAEDGGKYSGKR